MWSLKGKFHDNFFRRKSQNLRGAEKVLGMCIEILIFATKKLLCASELNWRNKKAKPIKFKHFYKKPLTSLFLNFSNSKQNGDIQDTFLSWNVLERKYCAEKKLPGQNLLLKI